MVLPRKATEDSEQVSIWGIYNTDDILIQTWYECLKTYGRAIDDGPVGLVLTRPNFRHISFSKSLPCTIAQLNLAANHSSPEKLFQV